MGSEDSGGIWTSRIFEVRENKSNASQIKFTFCANIIIIIIIITITIIITVYLIDPLGV